MSGTEAHGSHVGQPVTGQTSTGQSTETRGLGEIVSEITSDFSTLVKQEVDLAKVELKQDMSRAGKGAGMLGGAALGGYMVLLFLSVTLLLVLDNWMPIELAALVTTLVWAVIAGVLALVGRANLKKSNPQLPKTQQTLKEDASWAKAQRS